MKTSSQQIFNAAITLMAGVLADPECHWPIQDVHIKEYIRLAQRTAELTPEVDNMPTDEELRLACIEFVPKEEPIGASLLNSMFASKFGATIRLAIAMIQRAEMLGYVVPEPAGKGKTIYYLSNQATKP